MHPLSDYYQHEIECARKGDIAKAQKLLRDAASAIRERLDSGGANIQQDLADYVADCLERIAGNEKTARLCCLEMPKHRPNKDDEGLHRRRALAVIKEYQTASTLKQALEIVAASECKSVGAIRASFEKARNFAESLFLLRTPKAERNRVKLPSR